MSEHGHQFENKAADLDVYKVRTHLKDTFEQLQGQTDNSRHADGWNKLWKSDFVPWDQGAPSPALREALDAILYGTKRPESVSDDGGLTIVPSDHFLIDHPDSSTRNGKKGRAVVPGCGRGYDVFFLASVGYDVVGLDISEDAMAKAERYHQQLLKEDWKGYPPVTPDTARGKIEFRVGNFFGQDWETDEEREQGWDVVYDYTFLSALPPEVRPNWSARMASLLSPTGTLICLEYPTYKDRLSGGPPWALPPDVYRAHLSRPGVAVPYDDAGAPAPTEETDRLLAESGTRPLKQVAHWKARDTHRSGVDTDWIGVWQRSG